MTCKSCRSVNQSKFTAEMGIHFHGLKNIDEPACGYFQRLLSVWIAASPNSLCQKLNCVSLRKVTPLPQVNLELSLKISLRING